VDGCTEGYFVALYGANRLQPDRKEHPMTVFTVNGVMLTPKEIEDLRKNGKR
jgi:hypothetical protein